MHNVSARLVVVATLLSWLAPSAVLGRTDHAFDEYQVKAAFLYNFARFVSWPAVSEGPLVIAVAGEDPFGEMLDATVRGKLAGGRALHIRRVGDAADVSGCHILFISASEKRRVRDVIRRAGNGVLTVSDLPGFTRDGGVVRFFVEGNRVRFQINVDAAERAGLRIHSQLISLSAN